MIGSDRTYHIWIVWIGEFCLTHPEIHLVAGACPAGRSCSEHYQWCISQLWVVAHRRGTKGEVLCEKGIPPTPWKINMEPENDSLEDDFTFQLGDFRFHVNLPGCKFAWPTTKWTTIGFVEYWNGLNNWIEHSETKWVFHSFSNFWKLTTRTTNFYFFQKRHQKNPEISCFEASNHVTCHWRWSVGVVTPVVNWALAMWKIVAVHRTKWATGSGQFFGPTGSGMRKWPVVCKNFLWNVGMYQVSLFLFFLVKISDNLSKDFLFSGFSATTKNRCMSKKHRRLSSNFQEVVTQKSIRKLDHFSPEPFATKKTAEHLGLGWPRSN